jgi:very-short-patch-repair endonuclease
VLIHLSMRKKFLKYNPKLKATARMLRSHSTLAEILLWNQLKGKKILGYDFHRQKPIGNYIVDFFCPRLLLAVEIDGSSHLERAEEDKRRQTELQALGIRFLRFRDHEVKQDIGSVIDIIKEWVKAQLDSQVQSFPSRAIACVMREGK